MEQSQIATIYVRRRGKPRYKLSFKQRQIYRDVMNNGKPYTGQDIQKMADDVSDANSQKVSQNISNDAG